MFVDQMSWQQDAQKCDSKSDYEDYTYSFQVPNRDQ